VLRERRRLKVLARTLATFEKTPSGNHHFYEVLEIRAHNAGTRPVYVLQAGVITERGVYHPTEIHLSTWATRLKAPCMLEDGDTVAFLFDLLSFEGEWVPKAVWVEDAADRRYVKRLSRKQRRQVVEMVTRVRARVGPDADSQRGASEEKELRPA